jgi:hypothetical protein
MFRKEVIGLLEWEKLEQYGGFEGEYPNAFRLSRRLRLKDNAKLKFMRSSVMTLLSSGLVGNFEAFPPLTHRDTDDNVRSLVESGTIINSHQHDCGSIHLVLVNSNPWLSHYIRESLDYLSDHTIETEHVADVLVWSNGSFVFAGIILRLSESAPAIPSEPLYLFYTNEDSCSVVTLYATRRTSTFGARCIHLKADPFWETAWSMPKEEKICLT